MSQPLTAPSARRFWRLQRGESQTSPEILAAHLAKVDSSAALCVASDGAPTGEAWLEARDESSVTSQVQDLCARQGWEFLESLRVTPITELLSPINHVQPTHRLILRFIADPASISDLDAWYTEEHEEMLLRAPAWCRIRRFRTEEGQQAGRLIVHDVSDADVLNSDELREAMATQRRRELAELDWFVQSSRSTWRMV